MKRLINIFMSFAILVTLGSAVMSASVAQPVYAVPLNCGTERTFLGFPYWYSHLERNLSTDCSIISPTGDKLSKFIWQIVLNIIEIVSMATGYIAFGFVLYGGFQFISSMGKPDSMAKARSTIINACIGLVIAIASVSAVNVIMGII